MLYFVQVAIFNRPVGREKCGHPKDNYNCCSPDLPPDPGIHQKQNRNLKKGAPKRTFKTITENFKAWDAGQRKQKEKQKYKK
jgi:hypothetical protein